MQIIKYFSILCLFSGVFLISGGRDVFSDENPRHPFHSHVANEDCEIRGRKLGVDQYWKKTNATESLLPVVNRDPCFEHDVPTPGVLHPFVYEDTAPLDNQNLDPYSLGNLYEYKGIGSVRLWMNAKSSHICVDDAYYGNWERDGYYDWPEPYGRMTARDIFEKVAGKTENFYEFEVPQDPDYDPQDPVYRRTDPDDFDPLTHYEKNANRGIRVPWDGTGYPSNYLHVNNRQPFHPISPRKYTGNVFCIGDRPAIEGVMSFVYMPDCSEYDKDPIIRRVEENDGEGNRYFETERLSAADLRIWRVCVALAHHLKDFNTPFERYVTHRAISDSHDFHDKWLSLE